VIEEDAQNGLSARPQARGTGDVPLRYVEDFLEPRTKLKAIFSSRKYFNI
jgi:hypothetical protein